MKLKQRKELEEEENKWRMIRNPTPHTLHLRPVPDVANLRFHENHDTACKLYKYVFICSLLEEKQKNINGNLEIHGSNNY